jgi:hypothetical protein
MICSNGMTSIRQQRQLFQISPAVAPSVQPSAQQENTRRLQERSAGHERGEKEYKASKSASGCEQKHDDIFKPLQPRPGFSLAKILTDLGHFSVISVSKS